MSTTPKERAEVMNRLGQLGIGYHDAQTLRRCAMTLHRWAELECGDGNDYASWSIERDEETGKPYHCRYPHEGKMTRTPVADREKGALKRIEITLKGYPALTWYHQTDPRGASLYILKKSDVEGLDIASVYTRGVAVY